MPMALVNLSAMPPTQSKNPMIEVDVGNSESDPVFIHFSSNVRVFRSLSTNCR